MKQYDPSNSTQPHSGPPDDGSRLLHPGPRRILVAEDDQEMRALLTQSLRWAGYRVTECVDGWDLLSHLGSYLIPQNHENIDLVISDIRMPGLTGLEILRGTRGTRRFPPVILITAFGDDETHAEAARLGAAMLDKPFDMNEMLATVASTISGAQ
jgi:DNA-binding response OmpR family regulator